MLENYLARSITMEGLLTGRGDLDDNARMLKHIGAKFAWGEASVCGGTRASSCLRSSGGGRPCLKLRRLSLS